MGTITTLKKRREQLGLTAKYVAEKINVAPSTYFEWEQGRGITGEEYYIPLCKVLEISLTELITGKDPRHTLLMQIDEIEERVKTIRSLI